MERIIEGHYKPGARLIETQIARELGVSQAPVREALRELESVGMVESYAFRGARVRKPTREELIEAFPVRAALESLAAGEAAGRITDDQLDPLILHPGHGGGVPIARLHQGSQTVAQLRLHSPKRDTTRGLGQQLRARGDQLDRVPGRDRHADGGTRPRGAESGAPALAGLLGEQVHVDGPCRGGGASAHLQQKGDAARLFLGDGVEWIELQ